VSSRKNKGGGANRCEDYSLKGRHTKISRERPLSQIVYLSSTSLAFASSFAAERGFWEVLTALLNALFDDDIAGAAAYDDAFDK
jgi:hypothetical protein